MLTEPWTIQGLLRMYRSRRLDPSEVAAEVIKRIEGASTAAWITRVSPADLLAAAARLDGGDRSLPLYGVPFAVKDNIDVAGLPTTAGCPGFAYDPDQTAPAVQALLDAGALLVGKANMDQFATGLVGTRSPYGIDGSVFDPRRVSGGSSSGSAVAVALGHVAFALGTDTAGSGRVPAAFNGLVGLKPTRGRISIRGVVPACASLDCLSVFAHGAADAALAFDVVAGFDAEDPWSRVGSGPRPATDEPLGIPLDGQLSFDEPEAEEAWREAVEYAGRLWKLEPVDVSPLLEAAPLLYAAWVAERTTDLLAAVDAEPEGLDPSVATIVRSGRGLAATDAFRAIHRVAALRRAAEPLLASVGALLLPTVPGHPTIAEVAAEPLTANEALGRYTNFVNLLDLCAVAVPGPLRSDGLPAGVTLLADAFGDERLLALAARWSGETPAPAAPGVDDVELAVIGAHLRGMPLHEQLVALGARFLRETTTAPRYRLLALPDGLRPALARAADGEGDTIACEVFAIGAGQLGALLRQIAAPLGLGRVQLADGHEVHGFICEAGALPGARDITEFGGWRAWRQAAGAVR